MKTITIKAYTAKELQEEFPRAFERAHNEYKEDLYKWGVPWQDEIVDSLKALFEHTDGASLRDWSLGYDDNAITVRFNQEEAEDLQGNRALAWLENNLLARLRIGYTSQERWNLSKYGKYYRAGMIKPCPFTGVCFDEDYLDSLQKDIKAGDTLGEAFKNLGSVAQKLIQDEWDNQISEEFFIETADANEWIFNEDGKQIRE